MDNQPPYHIAPGMNFNKIVVPTIVRHTALLEMLLNCGFGFFCTDPTGTANYVTINRYMMNNLSPEIFMPIFFDDVSIPSKEVNCIQQPIELLRQWLDHGGWHDCKQLELHKLVDLQVICASGHPGVMLLHKVHIDTDKDIIATWLHETACVFSDRLVDKQDEDMFTEIINKELTN